MAAKELARILYGVNTILEKVSGAVGLSKRAAIALGIMALDPEVLDGKPAMTNKGLRDRLVDYKMSTELSSKKDASAAKTELLSNGYIATDRGVSRFVITAEGQKKLEEMMGPVMGKAIDETGLSEPERALLRQLSGLAPAPAAIKPEGAPPRKGASREIPGWKRKASDVTPDPPAKNPPPPPKRLTGA